MSWNERTRVVRDRSLRTLIASTTRSTRHAGPTLTARVADVADTRAMVEAARAAVATPRLDIV